MMGWFGQNNHMDVGYSSKDPAVVARQFAMLAARGLKGVSQDYYGSGDLWIDAAMKLLIAEAERRGDMEVSAAWMAA
jgi:hypothetical protein